MTPVHPIRLAVAVLVASIAGAVAAGPSSAARPTTHVIKAEHIVFSPEHLRIHRGDRVTWMFLDAPLRSSHTVTSVGRQSFKDSPEPRLTGSFTVRFNRSGSYKFTCTIHPESMNGVITVR